MGRGRLRHHGAAISSWQTQLRLPIRLAGQGSKVYVKTKVTTTPAPPRAFKGGKTREAPRVPSWWRDCPSRHRDIMSSRIGPATAPTAHPPQRSLKSGTVQKVLVNKRGASAGGLPARPDLASRRADQPPPLAMAPSAARRSISRGRDRAPSTSACAVPRNGAGPREARGARRRRDREAHHAIRAGPAAPSPGDLRAPRWRTWDLLNTRSNCRWGPRDLRCRRSAPPIPRWIGLPAPLPPGRLHLGGGQDRGPDWWRRGVCERLVAEHAAEGALPPVWPSSTTLRCTRRRLVGLRRASSDSGLPSRAGRLPESK